MSFFFQFQGELKKIKPWCIPTTFLECSSFHLYLHTHTYLTLSIHYILVCASICGTLPSKERTMQECWQLLKLMRVQLTKKIQALGVEISAVAYCIAELGWLKQYVRAMTEFSIGCSVEAIIIICSHMRGRGWVWNAVDLYQIQFVLVYTIGTIPVELGGPELGIKGVQEHTFATFV